MYSLKIIHHNIQSLNNSLHELKIFIKSHEPDIITLKETFKINLNTRIPNYTITQPTNNTDKGWQQYTKQYQHRHTGTNHNNNTFKKPSTFYTNTYANRHNTNCNTLLPTKTTFNRNY